MFRFVGTNSDGFPQKRSQSLRACDHCRKRKKRCTHTGVEQNDTSSSITEGTTSSSLTNAPQIQQPEQAIPVVQLSPHSGSNVEDTLSTEPGNIETDDYDEEEDDEDNDRFVGDLNPESIFLSATSPNSSASPGEDSVGIWLPRKTFEGIRKRLASNLTTRKSSNPDPLLANILLPYMQRQCLQLVPLPATFAALQKVYLAEIHPMFPILDMKTFNTLKIDSPTAIVMRQAVCLAASTSPRASNHLQLQLRQTSQTLQPAIFADQLSSAIRTAIDMGFVKDRFVIMQALGILSLFTFFSHQSHLSAEATARVISHSQTLGLHLGTPSTRDGNYITRLFCCVWILDKLNATFHGRPTMMHNRDFGRDLESSIAMQDGAFRLLLRLGLLLDSIISLYRPGKDGISACDVQTMPSFEDLIHSCDASRVTAGHLATIETLYHSITILSCRLKNNDQQSLPPDVREKHSAASLIALIGTDFTDEISHLPLVPYSLSLSLRVLYRELRFSSKSSFSRNRTRKQLVATCNLLRTYGETFPATSKLVDLAEQTVKEMDKAYNSMLRQQNSRLGSEPIPGPNHPERPQDVFRSQAAVENVESLAISSGSTPRSDPIAFETFPDLDLFDYIDSDFHLDAVDAAFIENMNFALPTPTDDTMLF